MNQVAISTYAQSDQPSSFEQIDSDLAILNDHKTNWVNLDLKIKIELLQEVLNNMAHVADEQVKAGNKAKGLAEGSSQGGEEWFGGPFVQIRIVRLMIEELK